MLALQACAPDATTLPSVGHSPTSDRHDPPVDCVLAPHYESKRTLFGTSLSSSDGSIAEAASVNDERFGRLPVVRQFDPAIPPAGAWSRRGALEGRAIVTSFRSTPDEVLSGAHDSAILQYFREAPTGAPIFWSYYHEPESSVDEEMFSASEYRRAWRHLSALVGELCRGDLFPTLILTGWTADERSGRDWRDYYPGEKFISVLAWDPYNSATETPWRYAPPSELLGSIVRISSSAKKPWGVAEIGSVIVPGDDGTGRAEWLNDVAEYLQSAGASFVIYFQSVRDAHFKLEDAPSVNVWRRWVEQSAEDPM